jgi:hypothetical protein
MCECDGGRIYSIGSGDGREAKYEVGYFGQRHVMTFVHF